MTIDHHSNTATVFGPFRRLQAAKGQSVATAVRQALSGEVWGEVPRYGFTPTVEAYPGELKEGETGIEFWAFQPPTAALVRARDGSRPASS